VLVQPLIFAHLDGFTVLGAAMPEQPRKSFAIGWVQQLCAALWSTQVIAFLAGVTRNGMRVFTAPVSFAPKADDVCFTPEQRATMKQKGVTWAWCTRTALRGTLVAPLAAQAILAASLFVKPPESVQAAAELGLTAEPMEFHLGKTIARSVLRRPLIDQARGPPADRALARLLQQDSALGMLLSRLETSDARLEGWHERIAPPPIEEIPPQLLANLPDFSNPELARVPLPSINLPYRLPWVAAQPPQLPPHEPTPSCPRPEHMLTEAAHVYRSLCGLLEHFRAINLRGRNVMHGLYDPHRADGVSQFGPEATVKCSPLMRKQLQRWMHLIFQSGGVDVRAAVDAELYRTPTSVPIVMDSDACHGDKDPSGIGPRPPKVCNLCKSPALNRRVAAAAPTSDCAHRPSTVHTADHVRNGDRGRPALRQA